MRFRNIFEQEIEEQKNVAAMVPNQYQCPLFVWKTGKLLANIHQALAKKGEVRMNRMGEMVELQIREGEAGLPLTLNLHVISGKAVWGYIDLPVLQSQEGLLKELIEVLKKETEATIGPKKKHVKFKFEGESVETETTTADVYNWVMNYGLRYNLNEVIRFLTALDYVIRQHGGRPLEGNEFFVIYRDGTLHLQDETVSFVLVTPWGYYSTFLHVGEETLELQICDEEKKTFPADDFNTVIEETLKQFESDKEIKLPHAD